MIERPRTRLTTVDRRVGGLEMMMLTKLIQTKVDRRVGGLENKCNQAQNGRIVDRRVGGLENIVH